MMPCTSSGQSRKNMLSSNSAFRDDIFLCVGVVEQPIFVTTRVSQEDAFLHMRLKRALLVLLNEDICKAFPNTKMSGLYLASKTGLTNNDICDVMVTAMVMPE
jgi:CRISPR/Cas system type I-B associated protein Csh2 (Cas7 group RAMP superfamily)